MSPGLIDNDSKLDWRKVGYYGRSAFAVLLSLAVLVGGGWFVYSEVKEAYVAWRTEDDYLGEGMDPVQVPVTVPVAVDPRDLQPDRAQALLRGRIRATRIA